MKIVITKENWETIDSLAEDGEAKEIEAFDLLDSFTVATGGKVLNKLVSKLSHGGTIALSCTDLLSLCKGVNLRAIDINLANEVLFGKDGSKKSAYSNEILRECLISRGLKILKNRTNKCKSIIIAERP